MKSYIRVFGIVSLIFLCTMNVRGETTQTETTNYTFANPDKPGTVKILGSGDVTVTGYNGSEVVVTTKSEGKTVQTSENDEKAKGLKRITGGQFHIESVSEDNALVISRPLTDKIDVNVKVPFKTSLVIGTGSPAQGIGSADMGGGKATVSHTGVIEFKGIPFVPDMQIPVTGLLEGKINVTNISGDMDLNTIEGNIILTDVSGDITAHTIEGDMTITFKNGGHTKPLYFSSIEGDIDVTLPSGTRADLVMKTIDGDIYSDFNMDFYHESGRKEDKQEHSTGSFNIGFINLFPNSVTAHINGGGSEINLQTIEGNIYVRKGK